MALEIEPPEPLDVTNRQMPSALEEVDVRLEDLRRAEIETALQEGAWRDAFQEWATYTDVDEESLQMAIDRELFAEFDFYFDPDREQVRAVPPSPPADWSETESSVTVAELRTALDDLGETVADLLVRDFLEWGEPLEGDYVWSEDTFSTVEPDEIE